MSFAALPPYSSNHVQDSVDDSITLGQLKAIVNSVPKPKQLFFDFRYDDEDTVTNEIDEFYSYIEMPQVAENFKAWEGSYNGEWTQSPMAQRRAHIEVLLESLEHRDAVIRFTNARRLFYLLQGSFAETSCPDHQLRWILENCQLVRAANGVSTIVEAMKIAHSKHDILCGLSDSDAMSFNITPTEKQEFIEEVTTEISVYLGMLYHLVVIHKVSDEFASELMSLDPPLPVYLFNVVALMRDKTAKGYPIKKLLLLLWKTLLSCLGGIRELARVKKLARELGGLPSIPDEALPIKSSPLDIEVFRQETTVKYPTFTPTTIQTNAAVEAPSETQANHSKLPPAPLLASRLAQAYSPIPIRHHYHHDSHTDAPPSGAPAQSSHNHPFPGQQPQQQQQYRPNMQSLTPAPSPPPSPKPKRQQYQTDQNRPFLFPFSKTQARYPGNGNARLVPFAIEEADKLYHKHMYISLALAQMWRTREECMTQESGLDFTPGHEGEPGKLSGNIDLSDADATDPLPDVALLDAQILEATRMMRNAGNGAERRKIKQRLEDLLRLKRVEQIYNAVLSTLSTWVLVLLKLLLAAVSASSSNQVPQSTTSSIFPPGVVSPAQEHPPAPPMTLEETDVIRHREVTSKAVSAILLLVLKWFKVSHVLKFHHLGQLLLDTNCLLLILKMFGLQEVSNSVVSKADSPENNFFRYCQTHFSKNPQPVHPEDHMPHSSRKSILRKTSLPNGHTIEDEVEMLTEFSWRNFFSTINFAKIMQKLSKHRSHRIWMLVQYKSSAVLKRILRVSHPMLQLHVLKLIKSQVPFSGRKWRQSNMKVITSIYLNCRPELRDEWLTGTEVDDVSDAQAQEQALRHLVKFYNNKRYGPIAPLQQHGQAHKRSVSMSHHIEGLHPGPELSNIMRPLGTPNIVDADVFPPSRSQAPDPSIFLPFVTEDIAFEEEYEEYLSDLGWAEDQGQDTRPLFGGIPSNAWDRLPQFASEIADGISDSESVASIGDLGDDTRLDPGESDENLNNWEHMSPKTMAALPKSPAGARRSSSGGGLRPVLPFGLDDVELGDVEDDAELGPMPRESGPFGSGGGVDEVEYAYGV